MKKVKKIVVVGLCLGLVLVIIQRASHIDRGTFIRGYLIAAPFIIVGAALASAFYYMSYQKRIRRTEILLSEGRTKEYIAETEKLLETAKGQRLRNIIKLNLAAGYIDERHYDMAECILVGLVGKCSVGSMEELVRRLNLCMCYFYGAQYEKAMELYNESQEIFNQYRDDKTYGGNMAAVEIFAEIINGQYGKAERMLDMARETWTDIRSQRVFQELDGFMAERKKTDFLKQF